MAFKCRSCGGHVHFDIEKQKLKCDYCGQLMPVEQEDKQDKGSSLLNLNSFVCNSCGAEILTPEESMLGYCSYCGSESLLDSKLTEELMPKYIMPFSTTKARCMDEYRKHTEKVLFLPKELKDPQFIEKFRGTYIPYWMYKVNFPEPVSFQATRRTQSGDEICETTFDVNATIDGEYEGIPYDASSCFDDTISDMLMPFDKKRLKEFRSGYLAGFYADRADVPGNKYEEDVSERASVSAYSELGRSFGKRKNYTTEDVSDKEKVKLLNPSISEKFTALFPVWFLTWRNRDRVAYAIVNGQSGKLSCDFPVDIKAFSISTLVTALVLFGIFSFLFSMTARTALIVCAFLTVLVMGLLNSEIREIRNKENHIRDRGYFVKDRQVKMPEEKREKARKDDFSEFGNFVKSKTGLINVILIVLVGIIGWTAIMNHDLEPSIALLGATTFFLIEGIILGVSSRGYLRYVQEKSLRLFNLLAFLSVAGAFAVALWNPVMDYYYYLAAAACAGATFLVSIGLIKYYNLVTTRPVPTFFDREGGRDNAKE